MAFEAFCIVEIMGHQVIAGKVSEETHFGAPLMRVDVPKSSKREGFTCYYGGGSIYKITPTTEEIVRAFVEKQDPQPVMLYMLALPTLAAHVVAEKVASINEEAFFRPEKGVVRSDDDDYDADELDDWGDEDDLSQSYDGSNSIEFDDDDPPDDDVIMTGLEKAAEAEQKNSDQTDGQS